jgi:hypothetical protein
MFRRRSVGSGKRWLRREMWPVGSGGYGEGLEKRRVLEVCGEGDGLLERGG